MRTLQAIAIVAINNEFQMIITHSILASSIMQLVLQIIYSKMDDTRFIIANLKDKHRSVVLNHTFSSLLIKGLQVLVEILSGEEVSSQVGCFRVDGLVFL